MQAHFRIHIFMDCCLTVTIPSAFQTGCHAAVSVCSIVAVADLFSLLFGFCLLGIIIRLPVFPVVITGIWSYLQPPEQPADAEFFMVLVDEPASL